MDEKPKNFGRLLRQLREKKGFRSASKLAEALDVSKQTVANWEQRIDPPLVSKVRRLAEILKVPPEALQRCDASLLEDRPNLDGGPPRAAESVRLSAPATREDCEAYFQKVCEAAEASGDADAFPVIHYKLRRYCPVEEWEAAAVGPRGVRPVVRPPQAGDGAPRSLGELPPQEQAG
jgi:transcriptional regulator with XRE-family HTH domain